MLNVNKKGGNQNYRAKLAIIEYDKKEMCASKQIA
jgi:hypothetical protein